MAYRIVTKLAEIRCETREEEFPIFFNRENMLFQYLPFNPKAYDLLKTFKNDILKESSLNDNMVAIDALVKKKDFLDLAILCLALSKSTYAKEIALYLQNSIIITVEPKHKNKALYCLYLLKLYEKKQIQYRRKSISSVSSNKGGLFNEDYYDLKDRRAGGPAKNLNPEGDAPAAAGVSTCEPKPSAEARETQADQENENRQGE